MTSSQNDSDRALPTPLAAGLATTTAFAAGCVLTQVVTVPMWRRMEPVEFLRQFRTSGPVTGAVLLPADVASVALLATASVSAVRRHESRRGTLLAAATAAMVGTMLLLPTYFARANTRFLSSDQPLDAVRAGLAEWNRWNWARTGLALAATVLSGTAAGRGPDDGGRSGASGRSEVPPSRAERPRERSRSQRPRPAAHSGERAART